MSLPVGLEALGLQRSDLEAKAAAWRVLSVCWQCPPPVTVAQVRVQLQVDSELEASVGTLNLATRYRRFLRYRSIWCRRFLWYQSIRYRRFLRFRIYNLRYPSRIFNFDIEDDKKSSNIRVVESSISKINLDVGFRYRSNSISKLIASISDKDEFKFDTNIEVTGTFCISSSQALYRSSSYPISSANQTWIPIISYYFTWNNMKFSLFFHLFYVLFFLSSGILPTWYKHVRTCLYHVRTCYI